MTKATGGPIAVFSNKQLDRSARVTLHETLLERPKRKAKEKRAPGSYANPKQEGAALPCTLQLNTDLVPIAHQYVRDGGSDFLKCKSKGNSC